MPALQLAGELAFRRLPSGSLHSGIACYGNPFANPFVSASRHPIRASLSGFLAACLSERVHSAGFRPALRPATILDKLCPFEHFFFRRIFYPGEFTVQAYPSDPRFMQQHWKEHLSLFRRPGISGLLPVAPNSDPSVARILRSVRFGFRSS